MGLNSAALPEIGKVVNIIPASHAAAVVGDVVSLKNYHKAYFILQYTGSGAANTVSVHLYGGATVAGIVAANGRDAPDRYPDQGGGGYGCSRYLGG